MKVESSKADLQARLDRLVQYNDTENNALREQVQFAESAARAAGEKSSTLQREVDKLERSKRENERTVLDQAARIDTLEATKTRLEKESAKAKSSTGEQDKLKADNDKLQQEKAALEKRVLELTEGEEVLRKEKDKMVAYNQSLYDEGSKLLAEHEELKKAHQAQTDTEAQRKSDEANAMVCDSSDTTSGCDFLGIDWPTTGKVFTTRTELGTHLLPTLDNAIEEKQAAVFPMDISKGMLAVDINRAVCVITPRFMAQGAGEVEPTTLVCEIQPKNFQYLAQRLLLPYRDPRNPQEEPSEDFSAHYAKMCLLAQMPEVWIEAAFACNLYNGTHRDRNMATLEEKIHSVFGKPYDSSRRAINPDAVKRMYEPYWNETVYRLSMFPAFKGALTQWAMGKDPHNLFGRWMPHVLKGVPRAEAVYECPPAAPVADEDDGLDTTVPDADTGLATGLEILDAANSGRQNGRRNQRDQHNNVQNAPAPQEAAPAVVDYDADGENVNRAYDFEGVLQADRRGARPNRRRNRDDSPRQRVPREPRALREHRAQPQPLDLQEAANRIVARAAEMNQPHEALFGAGDYYAAHRQNSNQRRQNQRHGAGVNANPVLIGPRNQQVRNGRGNGHRRQGGGRGVWDEEDHQNRDPQLGAQLGALGTANDAIQAYRARVNGNVDEPGDARPQGRGPRRVRAQGNNRRRVVGARRAASVEAMGGASDGSVS